MKSRKKIKNSLEVVRKQNVLASILLMQGPEYVVLGPIRPFLDILLMYITWVYEADVIYPFSLAFLNLHPTRLKIKEEEMRKHIISRAMVLYTNGRTKYTYIQNTQRRDLSRAS